MPDNIKTLFCIVSGQPIPNLTSAVDSRINPEQVVLLTSREMHNQAQRLKNVLERYGIKGHIRDINDRLNLVRVKTDIQKYLDEFDEKNVCLNVTGGQKPMSIAAYQVFYDKGLPIYYVETNNELTWINPQGQKGFRLETNISSTDYLESYGYRIDARSDSDEIATSNAKELVRELVSRAMELSDALGDMNWLAVTAGKGLTATIGKERLKQKRLQDIIALFKQHQLLTIDENRITFSSEHSRMFANGGWLEWHIASILKQHEKEWGIKDISTNVMINKSDEDVQAENELDVMFMVKNHLYIIECKTKRPKGGKESGSEITDMLYKLDSIRRQAGIVARAMLVSWYDAGEIHEQRAALSDIRLVSGDRLSNESLEMILPLWIGAQPPAR